MTCELPIVYHEHTPRARKHHVCCECRRTIAPGAKYVRSTGIWDGPRTYKTCARCARVRTLALKKYPPEMPDEGPAFGLLREWIKECHGN